MAEAAPDQFLENLSDTLKKHPDAVDAASPELLWALETLAWNQNSLPDVVMMLAELDTRDDQKDKHSNSAFRSLGEILHYGLPQSKTTAAQRIHLFEQLFARQESVAWVAHRYMGQLFSYCVPQHRIGIIDSYLPSPLIPSFPRVVPLIPLQTRRSTRAL